MTSLPDRLSADRRPPNFRPCPIGAITAAELDRLADHQLAHGRTVQAERLAEMAELIRGPA